MDDRLRIESALERAVSIAASAECPPRLAEAVHYAVFPGGARIRPLLTLAVAKACGGAEREVTDAAAASIELLHCASLVHDDLPCFDDAETRRGRPSVHAAFGQPLAVLVGDALIVLAFERLGDALSRHPKRLPALITSIGRSVGMSGGLVAGQAWESEDHIPLELYHRAKTGALFVAACTAGAASAGYDPARWLEFGLRLGEAYQVADDMKDATSDASALGKPVGKDCALDRPSAVRTLGLQGAVERLHSLVTDALQAIPPCPGAGELRADVRNQACWFAPKGLALSAA
jgi:geranylgeranyl diphosphate synthase type II